MAKPKKKSPATTKSPKKKAPAGRPKRAPGRSGTTKAKPIARTAPKAVAAPLRLSPAGTCGGLVREDGPSPIEGAVWYAAQVEGDGLDYRFPAGALAGMQFLTADLLLDGRLLGVFRMSLREGDDGPTFHLSFALLPQCSARMRARLEAVNQNRWRFEREGAWLKPLCGGDRVDLARVDRMTISVVRKGDEPVRWCMTDVTATPDEPPRLKTPALPHGKLIDEMGQCATHGWSGKSRSPLEVTARLESQLASSGWQRWPDGWSKWGGWTQKPFEATGFFRTHHDGSRWWLVDPEGLAFWSAGIDCVRVDTDAAYGGLESALSWIPEPDDRYAAIYGRRKGAGASTTINYLAANFIRAFGPEEWYDSWSTIALALLRRFGFNTVANWSDWRIARAAGFPYVRPLDLGAIVKVPTVFRDFPDVFAPAFERAAEAYAAQLAETADDPALIGYFLMNEPTWGFARQSPAAGMLLNSKDCATRRELSKFLKERYVKDRDLSAAWGLTTSFRKVAAGEWTEALTKAAETDLASFSGRMTEKLFRTLSEACKKVDAHHLNLGARYFTVPPSWAAEGMKHFDVFSMNCYRERVPADRFAEISALLGLPIMVGEWHFGAHDVGLPASGIGRVRTQADRGAAFRFYTEDAAARPECVGVHYFTLYDQSALGRFDGECYNIGFLDVGNRPYEELATAARETHERLYPLAAGEVPQIEERPEYLPKLFL